jgi:2-hydroxychromene-2-carboxylate isomerase
LQEVLDRTGLEQTEFFQKITIQLYKDKLRANTEELIHRGGFGSPTMFLNQSDMFFGNDRLTLLEARLG